MQCKGKRTMSTPNLYLHNSSWCHWIHPRIVTGYPRTCQLCRSTNPIPRANKPQIRQQYTVAALSGLWHTRLCFKSCHTRRNCMTIRMIDWKQKTIGNSTYILTSQYQLLLSITVVLLDPEAYSGSEFNAYDTTRKQIVSASISIYDSALDSGTT